MINNKKEIIKKLRKLEKHWSFFECVGICYKMKNYDISLQYYFKKWPLFSDNDLYPIQHKKLDAETAYDRCLPWNPFTQYGKDRRTLCKFIADTIEQEGFYINLAEVKVE